MTKETRRPIEDKSKIDRIGISNLSSNDVGLVYKKKSLKDYDKCLSAITVGSTKVVVDRPVSFDHVS